MNPGFGSFHKPEPSIPHTPHRLWDTPGERKRSRPDNTSNKTKSLVLQNIAGLKQIRLRSPSIISTSSLCTDGQELRLPTGENHLKSNRNTDFRAEARPHINCSARNANARAVAGTCPSQCAINSHRSGMPSFSKCTRAR